MSKPSKPHVALLASPALGHLIPIVELANRLVAQHGFTVTVFAVARDGNAAAEDELLRSASSSWDNDVFNFFILPNVVDFSFELDPEADVITVILARVRVTLPTLRSLIFNMKVKPTALIVDQFGIEALNVVGEEFNTLKYVFVATSAWFLAYYAYLPYVPNIVNPNNPFHIPGCESILGGDLPVPSIFSDNSVNRSFTGVGRDSMTATDGILVNTWEDLEPRTLKAFEDKELLNSIVKAPVYPIGPVIRRPHVRKTELTEWLDVQPDKSVIYVSFGSGGTMSTEQTIELACGLEMSKHRFIWVIRPPVENDTAATLFKSVQKSNERLDESIYKSLPNGFLERTRDLGKVIPRWAPQTEILQHRSVGGFLSHCGWNSVLESIVINGLPIIGWPLYAEQAMNSAMLADDLGIAIRPKVNPGKEIVTREEIETMVKHVMGNEGFGLRTRVEDLKMRANRALDEGGSSYCALSKFAKDCEMKLVLDQ